MLKDRHHVSLRSNAFWFLAGNILYAASQWGLLVLIAKIGSPEMLGTYTLGLSVSAPIIMFCNLRLRFVLSSDMSDDFFFYDYLSLRLCTTLLAFVLIFCISLAFDLFHDMLAVVIIIAIAKSLEAVSDIYYALLQRYEYVQRIALSLIVKGAGTVFIFSILLYFFQSIEVAMGGIVFVWGSLLAFYDRHAPSCLNHRYLNRQKISFQFREVRSNNFFFFRFVKKRRLHLTALVKKALPLGMVAFLVSLSTNIPRYIIDWSQGDRALGFYSALTYIMIAGVMVIGSCGQPAIPRLALLAHDGKFQDLKRLIIKLLLLAFLMAFLGWIFVFYQGATILRLFYGKEYAVYAKELSWVMVAAGLNYIALILWYTLTALQHFRIQVYFFVTDVIIVTLVSFWLVPQHGIIGAIIALICVMAFHVISSGMAVMYCIFQLSKEKT